MRTLLVFALLSTLPAFAGEGDVRLKDAPGKELVTAKACATCHGEQGNKPSAPDQPVLAGQYEDYLVKALSDYKNDKRKNPIMKGFASQLSKKDMEDLAAWFSSQKSPLHNQR